MSMSEKVKGLSASRLLVRFYALVIAATFYVGPALAQDDNNISSGFLCSDTGAQLVVVLNNIITIFMVIAPVMGIIVALFFTVASASDTGGSGNHDKNRRNALIAGFSVPIGAYFFQLVLGSLFGFDISCIIPG